MAKAKADLKSLARSHTETAVRTLASIMNMSDAPHASRVSAAQALLDRGWGKAEVHVTSDVTVRNVVRIPEKAKSTAEWQEQLDRKLLAPPTIQ